MQFLGSVRIQAPATQEGAETTKEAESLLIDWNKQQMIKTSSKLNDLLPSPPELAPVYTANRCTSYASGRRIVASSTTGEALLPVRVELVKVPLKAI